MPSDFSVVALIAAYNEADIIEQVVSDLIKQGVQVYFLDDGSTDGTVAVVERHLGHGVLGVERLANPAATGASAAFDWERILRRKTELATELEASWFIHHDADEFRESPWSHLSLRDAIQHVDGLGFNAIDFTGLDFWPVHDQFRAGDDVRDTFTRYAELAPYDRVQIRCWKKTASLDLASSGGHEAQFPRRRVFPLRFILRHYPIRGQTHGDRKVFQERRSRFREQERAQGWHVQYDQLQQGASFLRDPSTLTAYDSDGVRLSLALNPRYPQEIEEALFASQSELAAARSEMNARHREIEAASKHIEHVTAQLTQAREALRAKDDQIVAMHREIETASTHIEHVTAMLVRTREEVRARTLDLADTRAVARAELDARSAHIAALVEALDRRSADIVELTRQRHALERSLSWRWTAPARAIVRLLKGS